MKTLFILFSACILFVNGKKDPLIFSIKEVESSIAPVTEKLYAGKFEVSNRDYKLYLIDLKQKGLLDEYNKMLPDTTVWIDAFAYNEPYVKYYFQHEAYLRYPLVGINHDEAISYCNWLTQKYNDNPNKKFKKIKFRLPTEEEWEMAARGGLKEVPFPWGGPYLNNSKGMYLANFKRILDSQIKKDNDGNYIILPSWDQSGIAGSLNDNADVTAPVKSYVPNDFGLYNISGNVSEMLADKGNIKGGSWNSPGYYLLIDAENEFPGLDKPSPFVGFRYFMEVVEQ